MRPGRRPKDDPFERLARAQLAAKTTVPQPVKDPKQPDKPKPEKWSYGGAD